jgi:hypothetical protein
VLACDAWEVAGKLMLRIVLNTASLFPMNGAHYNGIFPVLQQRSWTFPHTTAVRYSTRRFNLTDRVKSILVALEAH